MSHTFRFQAERQPGGQWNLYPDELHHIRKVLRLESGHLVEVCDGRGWVAQGRLVLEGKSSLDIATETFTDSPSPDRQLIMAIGAVKPQSIDELLPSLVELGVDRLLVFPFAGMAKSRLLDKVKDRWERIVAAACKQCKRSWWPEIEWVETFEDFLRRAESFPNRLILDPEASLLLADWNAGTRGAVLAVIGSEKGFDASEQLAFEANGFQKVRIEGAILRAVTAALATATLLRHRPQFRSHHV